MNTRTCASSALAALLLASAAAAAPQLTTAFPYEILAHPGSDGAVEFRIDAAAHGAFRAAFLADSELRLTGVPMPGATFVDVDLRPLHVLAPGAQAEIVGARGEVTRLAPSIATFSGNVAGEAGQVFLAVSATTVHGYVERAGRTYWLSSGPDRAAGTATLAAQSATSSPSTAANWCQTDAAPSARALSDIQGGLAASVGGGGSPSVRVADVIYEVAPSVNNFFATELETIDYVTTMTALIHQVYRRDLGIEVRIPDGYLRVWTSNMPFSGLGGLTSWFQSNSNDKKDFERAAVMLLVGGSPFGVATALETLCSNGSSYALTSVKGFFPTPLQHTHIDNHDPFITSHEFGHLFGSPHTFDYSPPITCEDGTGPDGGTIMSYCEFELGDIGQVGMRFHETVQELIRDYVATDSPACMTELPFSFGDYNRSGAVDAQDLATFESVLAQGFVSLGALDAFDYNENGVLDGCDHAAVANLAGISIAAEVQRAGSPANPTALLPGVTSPPASGEVWDPVVDHTSFVPASIADFLVISPGAAEVDLGAPGTLLCDAPYLTILVDAEPLNPFSVPIPGDCQLVGLQLCAQAGSSADGASFQLTNAIDFTIGNF